MSSADQKRLQWMRLRLQWKSRAVRSIRWKALLVPLLACQVLASPAGANMVWPALYLEVRLFSWWAIGSGLVVEFIFLWTVFGLAPTRAFTAALAANAASALLGIVLIPLAGIAWEILVGLPLYLLFSIGTFNPITWTATFLLACACNAVVEGLVLQYFFLVKLSAKAFAWLTVANALSVGLAFGSLWWKPLSL